MNYVASIIIPRARYHRDLTTALSSAQAQTVPCQVILIDDEHDLGAAYCRNKGLEQSSAPFTVFLDADDELAPDFVEQTCKAYRKGTYVYTSWQLEDGTIRQPLPACDIVENGLRHTITTLLPTKIARLSGGFLPDPIFGKAGQEDWDFYCRVHSLGVCGVYLDEPLLTYNRHLGHSALNPKHKTPEYVQRTAEFIRARYKDVYMGCGCLQQNGQQAQVLQAPGPDDIQVAASFPPQSFVGAVTGVKYPRTPMGQTFYINKRDAEAHSSPAYKGRWKLRIVPDVRHITPDVDSVLALLHDPVETVNRHGGQA